jgi:hypothetical protein
MSEREEPDWLAEVARGGDAVRRQIELLVQGAQEFVRDGQRASVSGGPVPPFQYRVVRAVSAAMRELVPAAGHPVRYGSFSGHGSMTGTVFGTSSITGTATVMASGSVTLPAMRVAGQMTVKNPASGLVELSCGQILALVLLVFATAGLLAVHGPDRAAVDHYLAVMSVAVPIALVISKKQDKQK